MRRTSAAAAVVLALLALSCLAQGRTLKKSQAEKDAEALAAQQAQQDALVADQAEREAELLRKQVEAQERKNRAAGSGGAGSSSDDSSNDGSEEPSGSKSSSSSSQDSQGCTKPDYSGMSRSEKRAAKKAYNKCRQAGDSTSYDSAGDGSDSVKTKSLKSGRGGKGGVRATYHFYSPAFETSSLYCADAFRGKEKSLLNRPWTAFCAESILGPMSQDKCGRCIRVTNLATGASIEANVVDKCGTGGMDLDPEAFNPIDTDGSGIRDGHLMVTVEWC